MKARVHVYAGCATCRKALKWLDERGVEYEAVPIVDTPPDATELRQIWRASGLPLKRLFNTSGQSYRAGGFKDRLPSMTEDEHLAALAADGKLIKRPLLRVGDRAAVGFSPDRWADLLESTQGQVAP